jgi:hypothetical protein
VLAPDYDATESLAYVYSRENPREAHIVGMLTEDEATSNIAKLPNHLAANPARA